MHIRNLLFVSLAAAVGSLVLAASASAHVLPPSGVPTGGDKQFMTLKADGDSVVVSTINLNGGYNDSHTSVCFETGSAEEFPAATDVAPDVGVAASKTSVTPAKIPNWTTCNAVVVWTKNGVAMHYEEREIKR